MEADIGAGEVEAAKVGRAVRINRGSLDAYMDHDLEAVFSVSLVAVLITHDRFVSLLTYAIPALSDSRQQSKG